MAPRPLLLLLIVSVSLATGKSFAFCLYQNVVLVCVCRSASPWPILECDADGSKNWPIAALIIVDRFLLKSLIGRYLFESSLKAFLIFPQNCI